MFPETRLTEAGATPEELATLLAHYDNAPAQEQQSIIDFYAPISSAGISEYLAGLRSVGYFADAAEAPETIPDDAPGASAPETPSKPTGATDGATEGTSAAGSKTDPPKK